MSYVTLENSRGVISKQVVNVSIRGQIFQGKKISAREQLLSIGGKFTSKGAYFQQGGIFSTFSTRGRNLSQRGNLSAKGVNSQQSLSRGAYSQQGDKISAPPPTPRYFLYHAAGVGSVRIIPVGVPVYANSPTAQLHEGTPTVLLLHAGLALAGTPVQADMVLTVHGLQLRQGRLASPQTLQVTIETRTY